MPRFRVFEVYKKVEPSDEVKKIVKLLSIGKTQSEVAEILDCKKRTLEGAISRMLLEYGCENATHLACMFLRKKLID